jgi:hypothetical protein
MDHWVDGGVCVEVWCFFGMVMMMVVVVVLVLVILVRVVVMVVVGTSAITATATAAAAAACGSILALVVGTFTQVEHAFAFNRLTVTHASDVACVAW